MFPEDGHCPFNTSPFELILQSMDYAESKFDGEGKFSNSQPSQVTLSGLKVQRKGQRYSLFGGYCNRTRTSIPLEIHIHSHITMTITLP
uniref:Uncharacterized protein n=1 Tax=Bracon brevicornis TaxID=1563983 RepID=A0A6V7IM84_9HYME